MSVLDQVRVIIYRVNRKGLEVFLVNDAGPEDGAFWESSAGRVINEKVAKRSSHTVIELEPMQTENGAVRTIAVEGDYHDIPSIRSMIKEDVRIVKQQIKTVVPGLETGAYCAVKDAFKKVLPQEYAALKELKDVVMDKNLLTNL
jgi:hypothetical protein